MRYLSILFNTAILAVYTANAQVNVPKLSQKATLTQQIGLNTLSIDYSRPSARGRKVFGEVVPMDKVWRTGANSVTRFKTEDTIVVEGKVLPKGEYGLFTIPSAGEWTIIFNGDPNGWGSYGYKEDKDVLRVKVKPLQSAQLIETFTIDFQDLTPTIANMVLSWERSIVKVALVSNPDRKVMEEINSKINYEVAQRTYFDAATYYFQNNKDLKLALEWATKAADKNIQCWTFMLKARIAEKLGDCKVATEAASKTL